MLLNGGIICCSKEAIFVSFNALMMMPALFLKDSGHLLPMEQLGGESDFTALKGSRRQGTSEHGVAVKSHESLDSCKPAQFVLCISRHQQLATAGIAVLYSLGMPLLYTDSSIWLMVTSGWNAICIKYTLHWKQFYVGDTHSLEMLLGGLFFLGKNLQWKVKIYVLVCIYVLLAPTLSCSSFQMFKDHLDTTEVFHFS